ncbi:MAG: serine protease [Bacteroides sp.]|nr:serine protease [Bacteroides sp.]MCM1086201.1 serine protease [Bacteroides sp.]
MSYFLIICLILVGFIFVTLELLVFPGTTLAGVAGLASLGYAIYGTFTHHGSRAGYITLAVVLALSVILLVIIFRSKTWRKLELNATLDGKVNVDASKLQVGMKGVASSRLAPMGTVEVEGDFYEASSQSSFIDPKTPVRVVKIEGGKVWVREDLE